jgi:hypothetical protein
LKWKFAIATLKKYKSPGSDQIPAELIQAGGQILLSEIHKLINSVWNKEELPDQWKESNYLHTLKNPFCNNETNQPICSAQFRAEYITEISQDDPKLFCNNGSFLIPKIMHLS